MTLVDVVVATESLSTLKELVIKAELVDTLSGEGPFTVFAPSNDASKALPAATLNAVQSNDALLKKVLLYHVLASKVQSTDLKNGETKVVTANDLMLFVSKSEKGQVTVQNNDKSITAKVVLADVGADNGVAHVIDQVLVPVDEDVTTTAAGTAVAKTLVDVVVATESLSTLKELVIKAELVDPLSGEGPFTVFAPSNDAFKALPAATLNAVQSNDALLKKVLLYHVLASKVQS